MIRSIATIALISAAALSLASTANAGTSNFQEPEQISVSTNNVDLNDARQAKVFYGRLSQAAAEVCDTRTTGSMITHYRAERDCERQAVTDAVRQINAPQLSAMDDKVNNRGGSARSMAVVDTRE
ncbi:UrcA family protein [Asticcacaulis sp. 201]|uniref:UrcA family protein n=1 Tax=Asticcacaulis sp. 201 TaxID=3028787 RepID=UPI002916045C|nr:UrcA family protein [Asticcacaulis sp. 201]MDV6330292.1 UrcA family protein [Asticcacaulis sp. 201]